MKRRTCRPSAPRSPGNPGWSLGVSLDPLPGLTRRRGGETDAAGRQTYYEELKSQLRPVVTKAAWVFEKNLETARKLGYDDEFVAQSEAKLSALQALLLAGDTALGQPHPRLAPEVRSDVHPEAATTPAGRKHFVPQPTPL